LIVDDLDAELIRMSELGVILLEGPMEIANSRLVAFIKAPDNVRIELMQIPS